LRLEIITKNQQPIFELVHASRRFGDFPALEDINFKVYPGEQVALVGPSGAGKSTLIRLLNGTLFPTLGEVWVLGRELERLKARELRQIQGKIGTIYQQFHLVDTLRVIHNVNAGHLGSWGFGKSLLSLVRPMELDTAYEALEQVGIPEKLYERTDRLSGGQQQRVAIARVLVQNPEAILADEPISNLDPELSKEIMDLLLDLSRRSGKTLVSSLHAIEFALSHYERIIGIREGSLLFDCPAEQVTTEMIKFLYQAII
jgi:phosphonate transport system ATP-binding protein